MHIPWGWIKQRPQFIAEELSKYFDVTVLEKKVQKPGASSNLPTQKPHGLKFKCFNTVPLYNPLRKNTLFDLLNKLSIKKSVSFNKYDYVWISSIKMYALLREHILDTQIVIYDCMDDELAFPSISGDINLLRNAATLEVALLKRANHIICSAENLKQVILNRTGLKKDIMVVNNASVYPEYGSYNVEFNARFNPNRRSIVYIGTVAKWFDFDSLVSLLERNQDTELYLFGPIDCDVPKHNRINIMGACAHESIWSIMLQSDILIMPFKINPLILSVNPVKLYEYIWSRKPIISIEYPESLKFSDFVYYYKDQESLDDAYNHIKDNGFTPKCQDPYRIEAFINDNSWESRVKSIVSIIC